MCIYGMDSPGGYQLVGRTLPIWNQYLKNPQFTDDAPWLLNFFDQVKFYPVPEDERVRLREAFREGRAQIRIEHTEFDFAQYTAFLEANASSIAQFQSRQKQAFDAEVQRWQGDGMGTAPVIDPHAAAGDDEHPGQRVCADLNGSVWKVLVREGQRVQAGDKLVIVEAMKMELAVLAPADGTIGAVRCSPGKPVAPGDVLLYIDALEMADA